jgi:hypothetical protein
MVGTDPIFRINAKIKSTNTMIYTLSAQLNEPGHIDSYLITGGSGVVIQSLKKKIYLNVPFIALPLYATSASFCQSRSHIVPLMNNMENGKGVVARLTGLTQYLIAPHI